MSLARMTCCKRRGHYIVYYFVSFGFIALSFLFALLSIFFHYPEVNWSKGDQIILEKQKPYILFKQRPDNLPHFCRGFRVFPRRFYGYEYDAIIVQATTSRERPAYSTSFSTYSFTEDIYLEGPKTRNLSYYLPSSSRFDITTCGQGLIGDDNSLNIPIFNDHGEMSKWLNSEEQDPESPDVILYAQFPPCPSLATVSFNTSGFPDAKWYFLLGTGRQYEEEDFIATLELQFTKHILDIKNPVANCTANAEDYCELKAPSGNDVYLMLEHSVNSTYPYASWIRVFCHKYDPYLSCMYFLVLPLGMSVCSLLIYCLLVYLGYCNLSGDPTENVPDLPGVMYCDAGTWRVHLGSQVDMSSSLPDISPPDYDRAIAYPDHFSDDGLANNFSTEMNSDISSLACLSSLHDSSTDVTMVTDRDHPPAYDSLAQPDAQPGQAQNSVDPPPGYETILERSAPAVTTTTDNPPPYDSLTQPGE